MTVSEKEGVEVGKALAAGQAVVVRGSYINPRFISIVKPINRAWFKKDFVESEERRELAAPNKAIYLEAPNSKDD